MTALLYSRDLTLLATIPGSRGVTSPESTTIKEAPHRFVFCGHDGRGLAMTLTRTLFCVMQGIFQIGASTATSAYTCGDRSDIVGVYQLRPDYTVDQMTAWLFSGDLALLATPPGSRGVTSPETTNIQGSTSPVRILWARWTRTGNDAYEDLVLRSAGHFPDRRIYSNERLHVRG
ncbi:hypothetical protein V5799_002420 [Amblyomma americanum]|uniref:Uncharacterized protein n=1 Tax=Amblyomma americanum TaxID=6943 RepID=A0AAQ4CX42_AMBAM